MHLAATCNFGLSSVLKREIERLGFEILESSERMIRFSGDADAVMKANVCLRTANRVYLEMAEGPARDFDALFELAKRAEWRGVLPENFPVEIRAVADRSLLSSLPAIQKTVKKAVSVGMTGSSAGILAEDPSLPPVSVLALLSNDRAYVLLDTSGDPLHKRGYRKTALEAPIKETLAAGLVLLSGWRFSDPFHDPLCGSGTIVLEAAMIARGMAPGLHRRFAFQSFPFFDSKKFEALKASLREREFRDKAFAISGSDRDADAVKLAREHAETLGLSEVVRFEAKEFPSGFSPSEFPFSGRGTVVTNPPYGHRLDADDSESVESAHAALIELFARNGELSGGAITSYEPFATASKRLGMKDRKVPNASIPCRFCYRMPERA